MATVSYTTMTSSITCQLVNLGSSEWSAGFNPSVHFVLYTSDGSNLVGVQQVSYSYGETSTDTVTFSGLSTNITYLLQAIIYDDNGQQYHIFDAISIKTSSSSGGGTTPIGRPVLTADLRTSTSLTCVLSNLNTTWATFGDTMYCYLSVWQGEDTFVTSAEKNISILQTEAGPISIEFTGLSPSTNYTIYAIFYHNDTIISTWATSLVAQTLGSGGTVDFTPTVSIAEYAKTSTSITIRVYNLATAIGCAPKVIQVFVNGDSSQIITISDDTTTETLVTLSGLSANTAYQIYCGVNYTGMSGVVSNYGVVSPTISVTTNMVSATRPSNFAWTNAKVQGGVFNLMATEWNSLTENINAVRLYYGFAPYNFTVAYSGNPVLASMYNECIYAISSLYPNMDSTSMLVVSNSQIKADLLNNLVVLINSL